MASIGEFQREKSQLTKKNTKAHLIFFPPKNILMISKTLGKMLGD